MGVAPQVQQPEAKEIGMLRTREHHSLYMKQKWDINAPGLSDIISGASSTRSTGTWRGGDAQVI